MAILTLLPNQDGYSATDGNSAVMVELDGGAPFIRKDQIGTWSEVELTWTLGRTEFVEFRTFYNTTTDHGTLMFEMYLLVDSYEPTLHKAMFVPGTVKFPSHSGHTYIVSATVKFDPTVFVP